MSVAGSSIASMFSRMNSVVPLSRDDRRSHAAEIGWIGVAHRRVDE
jgi:hypothetical protein